MKRLLTITVPLVAGFVFCLYIFTFNAYAATSYTEKESNDYVENANEITVENGSSYSGSNYQEADWFKFTMEKGGSLDLKISALMDHRPSSGLDLFAPDIRVYREDDYNNPVYDYDLEYNYNLGYRYDKRTLFLSSGTYYVEFSSDAYDNFTYSYTFEFLNVKKNEMCSEPNDYISQATAMKTNKRYLGVIAFEEKQDDDFYILSVPKKGEYFIRLENVNITGESGMYEVLQLECMNLWGDKKPLKHKDGWVGDYATAWKGEYLTNNLTLSKGKTIFKISGERGGYGNYYFTVVKKPNKVKITSVKKKGKSNISVTWKKIKNVSGYKVYRATRKGGKYKLVKTLKGSSKNNYVDKKVRKKVKYFYKVRAFTTVNKIKYNGDYSIAKSGMIR